MIILLAWSLTVLWGGLLFKVFGFETAVIAMLGTLTFMAIMITGTVGQILHILRETPITRMNKEDQEAVLERVQEALRESKK